MMASSSAHTDCPDSEGGLYTRVASESEQSVGCCGASQDSAECRCSMSGQAATLSIACNRVESQQLEVDDYCLPSYPAHDKDMWCVGIRNLPDEVLIRILSHMSVTELIHVIPKVCSRWKNLSQEKLLWIDKEYVIESCEDGRTDQMVIQTLSNAAKLRKISMRYDVSSQVLQTLYTSCQQLTELHLDDSQEVNYSDVKNLVENCPKIHLLRIANRLLKSEILAEAVSQFQHLQVLKMGRFSVYHLPLQPLCGGCPQLSDIDFGISNVSMDDLRHFLNVKRNTLKSIGIKWTMEKRCVLPLLTVCADSLECLRLRGLNDVRCEEREALTALGNLRNLQKLKMSFGFQPPQGEITLAFKSGGLSKLKLLELWEPFNMDNDTVIAVCCSCPALQELNVRDAFRLTDAAFSQIHHLENLEKLDVSRCTGLGGALISCLTTLPRLHTLLMEDLNLRKLKPGLSSILSLSVLRCLKLKRSIVTEMPFDKFPGKLTSLRELHVDSCQGDTKAIDVLAEQMPHLQINGDYCNYPNCEWVC